MYMHVKKLAATLLPLLLSALLSACGGAPADETSNNQSSLISKPEVSSAEALSIYSSSIQGSSLATSASIASAHASSLPTSETDNYTRISRSSNSSHSFNGNSSLSADTPNDVTPPSATKLMLYQISDTSLRLIWDEASDNVGISRYEIDRNGQLIAILHHPINVLSDYQLLPYTDYQYTITAFDAAGNKSEKSPIFTVRTLDTANSSKSNSSKSTSSNSAKSTSSTSSSSSSKSTSSTPSSSSSSSRSTSSTLSSSSFKSTSSTSSSMSDQKSAKLIWTHPNQREDGQYLELDEIGGYEIRYRKSTDSRYTYILINSNKVTEYTHADVNDTEFEIAVFDTNGVYSRFVKVMR
jgi:hypothetical protein